MKSLILTLILVVCIFSQTFAQNEITPAAKHNKAIFIEALGNGIGLSANYEMRL